MAKLSSVYASALFDMYLSKRVSAEDYLSQVYGLRDVLSEPECRRVLLHPHVSSTKKREFFDSVFGEIFEKPLDSDLSGLLYLAISKNRESFVVQALSTLIYLIEKAQRKVRAQVTSAVPLSEAQLAALTDMLTRKLNKTVEIEQNIDPAVIGGIFIYADGYFIDRTIKTRLRGMKSSIIKGGGM